MTKRRLIQELGPGEFQDWMAYGMIDPFLHEREIRQDLRAAQTPMILRTVHRGKTGKSPTIGDCVFDWRGDGKPRQSGELIAARLKSYLGNIKAAQDRKKARDG